MENENTIQTDNLEEINTMKVFDGVNIKNNLMYRFNNGGIRYYFDDEGKLFPSVTSITDTVHHDKYVMMKLIEQYNGVAGYKQFMKERATYGTIMHVCIEHFIMHREISATEIINIVKSYTDKEEIPAKACKWWARDISADVAVMIKFLKDYNVRPLAVEYIGKSENQYCPYSGAADLIALMTVKEKGFHGETYKTGPRKGEPKETIVDKDVVAIIDFKSGRSGFYYTHALQLTMYREMLGDVVYDANSAYPTTVKKEYIKLFNVSPSPTGKTYKIKDQTNAITNEELMITLLQYKYKGRTLPETITIINDIMTIDEQTTELPINEYLKSIIQKKIVKSLIA